MDYLWTPWRYSYVSTVDKTDGCVFCDLLAAGDDEKALIVHRGQHNFIVLNAFPYTCGHVMVVPYEHVDRLNLLLRGRRRRNDGACHDGSKAVLTDLYQPSGINLGMNIGKAAGAGVAGHIHMHVLPRWMADANFMTVVGETRVLPESLEETYRRVKAKF